MELSIKKTYSKLIEEHRSWLKKFGGSHLKQWEKIFRSNVEAALCEAATRRLMSEHKNEVEPYGKTGVDFKCTKNGHSFYVETTCITKEIATVETGLSDSPKNMFGSRCYSPLTETFWYELGNKTHQCRGLDAPCIVVIATFHFQAGCLCFTEHMAELLLTGRTYITKNIDPELGQSIGETYESTKLELAAFIRPSKIEDVEHAKKTISATLLCSFGTRPKSVVGVLHPNPIHFFDRNLLPDIKFCKLADGYETGQLKVEWV